MPLQISNRDARRLWLHAQGLAPTPTGPLNLKSLITSLGLVQLDTIRNITRAHHHILWSRNQNYREPMLDTALAKDRIIFEHFTHDASVLPIEFYPAWGRQFRRLKKKVRRWEWHRGMLDETGRNGLKERILLEGPLCTDAFDTKVAVKDKKMWARPPHKLALDYMWYSGELSTSHRENFRKFYDLTERVIPAEYRDSWSDDKSLDWLCWQAIDRLAFGSAGDIQRYWEVASAKEVKAWVDRNADKLVPVEIRCSGGEIYAALATPDIEHRLATTPAPTSRLRMLNPFDPVIRDRNRLSRLFGFDYRIEIFLPAAKRKWGYYVYPLLEGDRFIGRIDAKADRAAGKLVVKKLWVEPKVQWTDARQARLDAELDRMARFIGVQSVEWL